jgi:predicted ATPase with chaperone activity
MPGAGSWAHHGLVCLDERPKCTRHVLEVLRQPLEKGITHRDNLPHVLDLAALAALAARAVTPRGWREPWEAPTKSGLAEACP